MSDSGILLSVLILIATAIVVVMIFKNLKLSPVLGYLVAGGIIGDYGFKIVTSSQVHFLAEFGVVFLLFAIGLELSFERLKVMRKYVFGLGSLQVIITSIVTAFGAFYFLRDSSSAFIIGCGLALSSTAIVLQVIEDEHKQNTQLGRISLAILLQQDFIVVPLLVVVPILSCDSGTLSIVYAISMSFLKAIISLLVIFVCGRLFLRPIFKFISSKSVQINNEIFIAATLLICLSSAWATESLGLSLALGAFMAGILVAETEFRLPAEESIYPFKGLLLGLFFMSVGMQINIIEVYHALDIILFFSLSLILTKALIIAILCRLFGFSKGVSISTGLLLSQGGEFAFILFNLAISNKIIDPDIGRILLLVVTCSMALTPLLAIIGNKIADHLDSKNIKPLEVLSINTDDLTNHVIIGGFGEIGQMIAKLLEFENINYVIIDINDEVVKEGNEAGFPIFKGDISQLDTLNSLGASRASIAILTINNDITIKKATRIISNNFSKITVIVRAPNLSQAHGLYQSGANIIIPENYENGLQMGGAALKCLGVSDYEINRIKSQFRAGSYNIVKDGDEDIEDSISERP
jgi:CPA2 family monovalent cation:H+ antiporter-2